MIIFLDMHVYVHVHHVYVHTCMCISKGPNGNDGGQSGT